MPLFTGDPYPEETIASLRAADRDAVRRALGNPQQSKTAGRYWFFTARRATMGFIGSSAGAIERLEWLAIEFDAAARVRLIDRRHGDTPCFASGVCALRGAFAAPPADDAAAKARRPGTEECAIYLYQETSSPQRAIAPVTLSLDGRVYGSFNAATYLFLMRPPGRVALSSRRFAIAVPCKPGEIVYVKQSASWRYPEGEDFAPVPASEGEAAVRARRLALAD